MDKDEMKAAMEAQLDSVKEFIKEAFCVDGEVTTTGKECLIIQKDGSRSMGVTFVANDSDRGIFMVTLSNPEPLKDNNVHANQNKDE